MSPRRSDMKGLFGPVTLSEHLQRRMGEHETSGALIQSLWNPSSSLVVPMAVRRGATKTPLLCFLAGNDTCCFSFQMSFTHLHWGADPRTPWPRRAWGKAWGVWPPESFWFVGLWLKPDNYRSPRDLSEARRFFKVHPCIMCYDNTCDRCCVCVWTPVRHKTKFACLTSEPEAG